MEAGRATPPGLWFSPISTATRQTAARRLAATVLDRGSAGRPRWLRAYFIVLLASDALATGIAGTVALTVLERQGNLDSVQVGSVVVSYPLLVALMVPFWLATLGLTGAYDAREVGNGSEEYRRVFGAAVRAVAVVGFISFAGRLEVARGFVALMPPIGVGLTLIGRYRVRKWVHRKRANGRFTHRVVVVGSREHARDLVRHLQRTPHAGYSVLGVCVPGEAGVLEVDGVPVPILGSPSETEDAIGLVSPDAIAISDVANLPSGALRRIAWSLEGSGIDMIVVPAMTDLAGPRIAIRPVAGLPLLHVEEPVLGGTPRFMKALVDRVLAGLAILILSPLFLAVAFGVGASSRGPVFYRQVRVGKDGRHFTIWKFRTMRKDADQMRHEVEHLNQSDGPLFKVQHDPRVTPVGRWLRRFSLDELPQIVQVATGHMSIVGPRPPLPTEVERYDDHTSRRLLVKPGLTGLWQVSGRADLSWDESVRLDLYYVENWSPALDFVILWKTVAAVVQGRGAY